MRAWLWIALGVFIALGPSRANSLVPPPRVKIIFDTDIGNDVDDVLALAVLHALESRGDCEILGVTVTNPDDLAGPFVDAIDTFYGRPNIPIGCVRPVAGEPSKYLPLVETRDDGHYRYPHRLKHSADAPLPVPLLRKLLSKTLDQSVVMVQVGYFTNLRDLLQSAPDAISPMSGAELVKKKVKFLSVMAGAFHPMEEEKHFLEFNVVKDLPAARELSAAWPTPMVWSGFEIGISVPYPATSIQHDFGYVKHHPVAEAYYKFMPPPHERPTWDLTAALYAVRPDAGYFDLSPSGRVTMDVDGFVHFTPATDGRDRYLILKPRQVSSVRKTLTALSSQPPDGVGR